MYKDELCIKFIPFTMFPSSMSKAKYDSSLIIIVVNVRMCNNYFGIASSHSSSLLVAFP